MSDYDPNFTDAMFSRIVQSLERIEAQVVKTNGRVSSLEAWRTDLKARIALISIAVSGVGSLVAHWLLK